MKKYLLLFLSLFTVSNAAEQACHSVIMVRPAAFGFNEDTSGNNPYQHDIFSTEENEVNALALIEFDQFVERLEKENVAVFILQDNPSTYTPDSIFPNNWISLHHDGTVITYPMFGENRRKERELPVMELLGESFTISRHIPLEQYESEGRYLEGTGSIVFDHVNRVAFACMSERTDLELFEQVCEKLEYSPVAFDAFDSQGNAIYHTNIMLFIGTESAVLCKEAIVEEQRLHVTKILGQNGRKVIEISFDQLDSFCGNILEMRNREGKRIIAMSDRAASSFTKEQMELLGSHASIITAPIDLIETVGGGGARCMLLGNHLPMNLSDWFMEAPGDESEID